MNNWGARLGGDAAEREAVAAVDIEARALAAAGQRLRAAVALSRSLHPEKGVDDLGACEIAVSAGGRMRIRRSRSRRRSRSLGDAFARSLHPEKSFDDLGACEIAIRS